MPRVIYAGIMLDNLENTAISMTISSSKQSI